MAEMLCLFFHFNYLFQSNYWLFWESEKSTSDFVISVLFHFIFFNSIIQGQIAKVKKKKYYESYCSRQ